MEVFNIGYIGGWEKLLQKCKNGVDRFIWGMNSNRGMACVTHSAYCLYTDKLVDLYFLAALTLPVRPYIFGGKKITFQHELDVDVIN